MNDFSLIDAQDEVSRLAQITTEELPVPFEMTEEGQRINQESWAMLEQIHDEVAPVMANLRLQEDALNNL